MNELGVVTHFRFYCNFRFRARKSKSLADIQKYKQYRNTLNRIKLHEKRQHYNEIFKKIGKNSKLLWDVLNRLIKGCNNKMEICGIKVGDEMITGDQRLSGIFVNHFANAGKKVQDSIE